MDTTGFNRVTFGHPAKDAQRIRNSFDYDEEPDLNFYRNEPSSEYLREKFKPTKREISKQILRQKLGTLSQQLFEVIFLKESVMSMVGEQRIKMGDFMRQLKKYLFQLGVKSQRESLGKQSRSMNESSQIQFKEASSQLIPSDSRQLQKMCEKLMKENADLKEKYQKMLLRYRSQIESLSSVLTKPQEQSNNSNQQIRELKQIALESQQKLKQEQLRFTERVKYLQSEILALEDEYLKQKQSYQRQIDQYKLKQRQIIFQQSQIQRKNILLIEREKQLTQREIIAKQERNALDRRETKIADFQHNQLRRQRNHYQQQKNALRGQYYNNYDRPWVPETKPQHINRFNNDTRSEREKSVGRLTNSRVDINARLRQIQMQKRNNYGGIKNSRMSQAGGLRNDRSSSKGRNQIVGLSYQPTRKEAPPQNVNLKLQSMLESLQRDLHDIK